MSDVLENQSNPNSSTSSNLRKSETLQTFKNNKKKGGLRRDESSVVRDMITALALCHNVTPTYPDASKPDFIEYQASSPDEIALVKFAESLDMRLIERDQQKIMINASDLYYITKAVMLIIQRIQAGKLTWASRSVSMKSGVEPKKWLTLQSKT